MSETEAHLADGRRLAGVGLAVNAVLALVKGVAGVLGNSNGLIADAVESVTDIAGSLVVWGGLRLSAVIPMMIIHMDTARPSHWPRQRSG